MLTAEQRLGSPDGYRSHTLHVEPDGSFSIVALVWRPGQVTRIHDHLTWCVFGVIQGVEHEELFDTDLTSSAPATTTSATSADSRHPATSTGSTTRPTPRRSRSTSTAPTSRAWLQCPALLRRRGRFVNTAVVNYRRARDGFTAIVAQGFGRWDCPSPCAEWDARGVVEHVIGFHDDLVLGPTGTDVVRPDDDPLARWKASVTAIDSAIDGASSGALGDSLLPALTGELLAHTWDLAKAIGVEPHLDSELCELSYGFLRDNEEQVRSSGLFGSAVPILNDDDPAALFIAFVGRDPAWSASSVTRSKSPR